MATIQDVYKLDSTADTSGIDEGTQAVNRNTAAIARAGQTAARASGGLGGLIQRIGSALPKAARIAQGAIRGLAIGFGSLLAGGIFAVFNAIRGLPAFLTSMRDTLEGTDDAASGAGSSLSEASEDAVGASGNFAKAADIIDSARKKITGEFGALGKVGEGFIQRTARVIDQATDVAKKAGQAAKDAVDSLDEAVGGLGRAEGASTRFGKALDRLGAAWGTVKKIFFDALAVGLAPLIEELAKLMEDPAFQEFVKLIAEELAEALLQLSEWLAEDGIPRFIEFIETINEIGGPVEFVRKIIRRFRQDVERQFDFVVRAVIWFQDTVRKMARSHAEKIREVLTKTQELRDTLTRWFTEISDSARDRMGDLHEFLRNPWRGLANFIAGVWDGIQRIFAENINIIIDTLNALIRAYNRIAGPTGLPTISEIGRIGTPAPVTPPPGAMGALSAGAGGGASVVVEQIVVQVAPGGFATPEEAGARLSQAFIREMRAQGVRL
jgi:hypothetical protein